MRYKYEFDLDNFEKGFCPNCPLTYDIADSFDDYAPICVLGCSWENCPLEEVKEKKGHWTGYDGQYCSVCGLPWNYHMTMDGDDTGYFDPMPNFCPNCGAEMRSNEE